MKINQARNAERGMQNASHGRVSRPWFRTLTSDRRSSLSAFGGGTGQMGRGVPTSDLRSPTADLCLPTSGFTLIELLTVIAIIGVIAGMIFAIGGIVKVQQNLKAARGDLERVGIALENFKAKYGAYPPGNANPSTTYTSPQTNSMFNQLYYELSGVTNNGTDFVTVDGVTHIHATGSPNDVRRAFGVDGFINCSKSGDEEGGRAQNFLLGLTAKNIGTVSNNGVMISNLITTAHSDATYRPLNTTEDVNPIRYVYPGINNPNSYDLWVQIKINNKSYLLCNWTKQVINNSPMP